MKSINFAIIPRIYVIVGSILLGSTSLPANCFAQDPGTFIQGQGQQFKKELLDQLLGYYQFPNKVAFLKFELKDTLLFATQLWDNKEYQLIRINETNFESKDEGHKIEFVKDNSGHFNQAKILGRIMTTKVGFDPNKIMQLSTEQLKKLEGIYMSNADNNLKITIQSSKNELNLKQMWDNKEITFTPRSEAFFLNEDGTFPLTFTFSNGEVTQVICFENDIWLKAK